MFEPLPVHRLARAKDPATSKAAAVEAQENEHHRQLVLRILEDGHFAGLTSKEVARETGGELTSVQVTRRVHELRDRGLVWTLDHQDHLPERGHHPHKEVREGCCVIVLSRHCEAAVAHYKQQAAEIRQLRQAQGIVA